MDTGIIITLVIGLVVGLAAGLLLASLLPRLTGDAARDRQAAEREAAYRREVADHFVETAQLVNRLTDSYKEVFDHLREGAGKLVDEETLRQRLAHEEDKNVTLHLIGYREPGSKPGERSGKRPKPGDESRS